MNQGDKEIKISYSAAHFTSIVSVTLVLVLTGVIAMIWMTAGRETRRLREQLELSLIMADSISDVQVAETAAYLTAQPYALNVTRTSKEQAIKEWQQETGENLIELFGVNPLNSELNLSLKAEYTDAVQIAAIKKKLSSLPGVEDVSAPDTAIVDNINRTLSGLTILLGAIAAVMLIVSFVLINNTVHLTIYSRRFTIHTMQLVGATDGYIRRPMIVGNLLCGLISGLIASALLAVALLLLPGFGFTDAPSLFSWLDMTIVAVILIVIGMAICAAAAWIASTRYLNKNYEELF